MLLLIMLIFLRNKMFLVLENFKNKEDLKFNNKEMQRNIIE